MKNDGWKDHRHEQSADVGEGGGSTVAAGRRTLTMQLAPALQKQPARGRSALPDPIAPDEPQAAVWPLVVDDDRAIAARGVTGSGAPLPYLDELKHSFGAHGDALDAVRVHTGGSAAAAAGAIGAEAYATGTDIAFASAPSRELVAHEAAHVVQQRAGVSLKGGVGEAGDAYERNADEVGAAFAAGRSAEALLDPFASGRGGGGAGVQRKRAASTDAPGHRNGDRDSDGDGAFGKGALATNLPARIVAYQGATENTTSIELDAGTDKHVKEGLGGYVKDGDGAIARLSIDKVDKTHAWAYAEGPVKAIVHFTEVVINHHGPAPLPVLPDNYPSKVVDVQTAGGRSRVTLKGGLRVGVKVGTSGTMTGPDGAHLGAFTIEAVDLDSCYAWVDHVADTVGHATAILGAAAPAGAHKGGHASGGHGHTK